MYKHRYLATFKPLAFLALVTLGFTLSISPQTASAQPVPAAKPLLFLAAAPTQPGKLQRLKDIAALEGIQIETRLLDKFTGQEKPGDFDRFGLVVIDAPYGLAQGVAKERLGPLLPQIKAPWLWMQNEAPEAKGIDPTLMKTLHSYYSNGGRANFAEFFCQVHAQVFKHATRTCLPPQIFPDAGIYHPDYAGRVFPTLEDYLRWKKPKTGQPVIAILFHQAHFASELTGFLDDTIRQLEAAGAVALPIYASMMINGDITRLIRRNGKAVADVLINNQIMLNAEGRRTEFEALGIPVIQAMPFRRGEQADWEKDNPGVSTMDIRFYLAQPEYTGITDPLIAAYSRKADGDIVAIDYQLQSVVNKAVNLAKLRHLPNAEKKIAILFWNYPPGEKNLGASFLNLPHSIENTLQAMKQAGYAIQTPDQTQLTEQLQRLLAPLYRDGKLPSLLHDGLAARLPMTRYRAWFTTLPAPVKEAVTARFGAPEKSSMAMQENGEWFFVIPRLNLGNTVILPQPPRGEKKTTRKKRCITPRPRR